MEDKAYDVQYRSDAGAWRHAGTVYARSAKAAKRRFTQTGDAEVYRGFKLRVRRGSRNPRQPARRVRKALVKYVRGENAKKRNRGGSRRAATRFVEKVSRKNRATFKHYTSVAVHRLPDGRIRILARR